MSETGRAHWNAIYGAAAPEALSWYEAAPALSPGLVAGNLRKGEPAIDVGGGTSGLVDLLLGQGFGPLTVLDLSEAALAASRARLGRRAAEVTWIAADVRRWQPDRVYALWHDRATFHFLTDPGDRAAYVATLLAALRDGVTAILATFAEDGPEMCSGLPVRRYAPEELAAELERIAPGRFHPVEARRHTHVTPKGNRQRFQYSVFRVTPA